MNVGSVSLGGAGLDENPIGCDTGELGVGCVVGGGESVDWVRTVSVVTLVWGVWCGVRGEGVGCVVCSRR